MSDLTHVELLWLEKRIENWIRFGRHAEEQILDRRRRILSFAPGSVFAFIRWASNGFGTIVSRIDILRAVAPGQRCATVPYMRPGGDILLRLSGWHGTRRFVTQAEKFLNEGKYYECLNWRCCGAWIVPINDLLPSGSFHAGAAVCHGRSTEEGCGAFPSSCPSAACSSSRNAPSQRRRPRGLRWPEDRVAARE
jgi:hypothetical protein